VTIMVFLAASGWSDTVSHTSFAFALQSHLISRLLGATKKAGDCDWLPRAQ
jgi:hypothetical protein